jgi:predicted DsbA family dithiol-disulfide isomerase
MPVAELGYAPERWDRMMVDLAHLAEEEGLDLKAPAFSTNSRRALLLAEAAKPAGRDRFYALHEGLFEAYFCQGRNIGEKRELRRIAEVAGLARELVEQAWASKALSERLEFNLRSARALGISGTPAFVFGRRVLVGALPLARLEQAAAELVEAGGDQQQD